MSNKKQSKSQKRRKKSKNFMDMIGPYKIRVPKFAPAKRSSFAYPVYFPMDSAVGGDGGMASSVGDGGGFAGESIGDALIEESPITTYDYGALLLDIVDSPLLYEWTLQNVSEEDLFIDQSIGIDGYNSDYHITLLYGIKTGDVNDIYDVIKHLNPIECKGVKIKIFKKRKYDVITLQVTSPELFKANQELSSKIDHVDFFDSFQPHITLAYVKKNSYDHLAGDAFFLGKTFNGNQMDFSSKSGKSYKFRL